MITGDQIRQARKLLGWPSSRLAQRAKVHSAIVRRAESVDGQPVIYFVRGTHDDFLPDFLRRQAD